MGDNMDYKIEVSKRVEWIKQILADSRAKGIILGNSGGKDCTLVEILSKQATPNVLSVIMPCQSKRNYTIDRDHALLIANKYDIETIEIDVTSAKEILTDLVRAYAGDSVPMAYANMNPRLRMTVLYTIAQSKGYLVAGTGNASELYMGYFTKWGDGGCDFNPIADLTVGEVFGMLEYLGCPQEIITKAPSAGLYEGQTDEADMGVTYADIDRYIKTGESNNNAMIERAHAATEHKRQLPKTYGSKQL